MNKHEHLSSSSSRKSGPCVLLNLLITKRSQVESWPTTNSTGDWFSFQHFYSPLLVLVWMKGIEKKGCYPFQRITTMLLPNNSNLSDERRAVQRAFSSYLSMQNKDIPIAFTGRTAYVPTNVPQILIKCWKKIQLHGCWLGLLFKKNKLHLIIIKTNLR